MEIQGDPSGSFQGIPVYPVLMSSSLHFFGRSTPDILGRGAPREEWPGENRFYPQRSVLFGRGRRPAPYPIPRFTTIFVLGTSINDVHTFLDFSALLPCPHFFSGIT